MREKPIEQHLRRKTIRAGGLCLKWVSPGCAGVPDRILLLPHGVIAFVETKATKGKLRPRQKRMLAKLEKLGFEACVVNSKKQADKLLYDLSELYQ